MICSNLEIKDGVLFSKDMSVLIAYPSYKEAETYVLHESVKTVSDYAFSQCWNLKKIVLSNNLIDGALASNCFKNKPGFLLW